MAERKWSSPRMFLSLLGDKTKARRLQRKARVLVGYLFDQLMPGQTYRTNNWRIKDGSIIRATVWRDVLGERAQVKIFSPPSILGSDDVSGMLLSGWFYVSNPIYQNETTPLSRVFPRLDKKDPVPAVTYGPWRNSAQLAEGFIPAGAPCNAFLTNVHDSLLANRGSLYTGKMRYVVQALQGTGQPIPFNFQWCDSNGIFVNQDDESWWGVHIAYGKDVTAWPLRKLRDLTDDEETRFGEFLPFIPAPAVPVIASRRVLLSAAGISDAYGGLPFYTEHGWAFSYSGHEAQLLSVTHPDDYKRSSRWKLSITTDENGDPESATLSLEEEVVLWGELVGAPKYPQYTPIGVSLLTYDIFYSQFTDPEVSTDAPIDVFYKVGTDKAIVTHMKRYGSDEDIAYVDELTETTPFCGDLNIPDDPGGSGFYSTGAGTLVQVGTPFVEISIVDIPFPPQQVATKTTSGYVDITYEQVWDNCCYANGSTPWNLDTWSEYYRIEFNQSYGNEVAQTFYAANFIKPFFDRESMYLFEQAKSTLQQSPGQTVQFGAASGTKYNRTTEATFPEIGHETVVWYKGPDFCTGSFASSASTKLQYYAGVISALGPKTALTVENLGCSGGTQDIQYFEITGDVLPSSACEQIASWEGGPAETLEEYQKAYVYNPALGDWEQVLDAPTYDSFASFYTPIFTPDDGSQLLFAYFDVFTGSGLCSSDINAIAPADMHFTGELNANYPTDEESWGFLGGWFGVP